MKADPVSGERPIVCEPVGDDLGFRASTLDAAWTNGHYQFATENGNANGRPIPTIINALIDRLLPP